MGPCGGRKARLSDRGRIVFILSERLLSIFGIEKMVLGAIPIENRRTLM